MNHEELAVEIEKATEAHEAWKVKLRQAVESGTLPKPASEIACDDQCAFGKWLHRLSADKQTNLSMRFRKVMRLHADFHTEAGRIASLVEEGEIKRAGIALNSPALNECSERLGIAMADWKASV